MTCRFGSKKLTGIFSSISSNTLDITPVRRCVVAVVSDTDSDGSLREFVGDALGMTGISPFWVPETASPT
jgi:hypothetical protein